LGHLKIGSSGCRQGCRISVSEASREVGGETFDLTDLSAKAGCAEHKSANSYLLRVLVRRATQWTLVIGSGSLLQTYSQRLHISSSGVRRQGCTVTYCPALPALHCAALLCYTVKCVVLHGTVLQSVRHCTFRTVPGSVHERKLSGVRETVCAFTVAQLLRNAMPSQGVAVVGLGAPAPKRIQ
jgi:hypothetical protein